MGTDEQPGKNSSTHAQLTHRGTAWKCSELPQLFPFLVKVTCHDLFTGTVQYTSYMNGTVLHRKRETMG